MGWIYRAEKLRGYINEVSDIKIGRWWNVLITVIIPVLLVVLLVSSLFRDIKEPYGGYSLGVIGIWGWGMLGAIALISYLLAHFSKPHEVNYEDIKK